MTEEHPLRRIWREVRDLDIPEDDDAAQQFAGALLNAVAALGDRLRLPPGDPDRPEVLTMGLTVVYGRGSLEFWRDPSTIRDREAGGG